MKKDGNKKERRSIAAQLGSAGGKAVLKKYGKKHMKNLAQLGGRARWAKGKDLLA